MFKTPPAFSTCRPGSSSCRPESLTCRPESSTCRPGSLDPGGIATQTGSLRLRISTAAALDGPPSCSRPVRCRGFSRQCCAVRTARAVRRAAGMTSQWLRQDRLAANTAEADHIHSVSNCSVHQDLWRVLWVALAVGSGSCQRAENSARSPAHAPAASLTRDTTPECRIAAHGVCRVGCDADPPKRTVEVPPDLSGLDVAGLRGLEIVEILIDVRGDVQEACLLRGVGEDVDRRAVAAVRRWRFEPARLRHSTPPGLPVPVVTTVTLWIGASP